MIDGLIKTRDPSHPPFFASMAKKWKLQAMLVNKAFFSYLNAASLISDPPTGLSHPIFYPKPIRHGTKNSGLFPNRQLNYQMNWSRKILLSSKRALFRVWNHTSQSVWASLKVVKGQIYTVNKLTTGQSLLTMEDSFASLG